MLVQHLLEAVRHMIEGSDERGPWPMHGRLIVYAQPRRSTRDQTGDVFLCW